MKIKINTALLLISIFSATLCLAESNTRQSPAKSLDELLLRVMHDKNADATKNKARLDRFKAAKDEQASLYQAARNVSEQLEAMSENLNIEITENDQKISSLNEQLKTRLGNFGELFGVTRQVANDTATQLQNSLISAEFPKRDRGLLGIASSKKLPTMDQLHELWAALLREQTEQGRIKQFNSNVANELGIEEKQTALRIGPFSASYNGKFLSYDSNNQTLKTLHRQPIENALKHEAITASNVGDIVEFTIDPSRGVILGLLIQTPKLLERFHQGGLPGYVVSALAVIGLIIGLTRLAYLSVMGRRIQQQMKSAKPNTKNPLGRIFKVYAENTKSNIETLELKLEDAILKEIPKLEKGLNTIKVLAAVAPLIGLLGTVVGMILTFQAITLWGTGDPKIMAGGISQALVTTVQGLIAAIPLLLLHSATSGRARLIQQVLEEQSAGLIASNAERGSGSTTHV